MLIITILLIGNFFLLFLLFKKGNQLQITRLQKQIIANNSIAETNNSIADCK